MYSKNPPKVVNFDEYQQKIVDFFKFFSFDFSGLGFKGMLRVFYSLFMQGEFFFRGKDEYYLVQLHFPYLNWKYYAPGFIKPSKNDNSYR